METAAQNPAILDPEAQAEFARQMAARLKPVGASPTTAAVPQDNSGIARMSNPQQSVVPPVAAAPQPSAEAARQAARHGASPTEQASAAQNNAKTTPPPQQQAPPAPAAPKPAPQAAPQAAPSPAMAPIAPVQSAEDKAVAAAQGKVDETNKPHSIARLIPMTPMPQSHVDENGNTVDPSFWSKLGHGALRAVEGIGKGAATVAETAGNIALPGVMMNIPGSQMHNYLEQNLAQGHLAEAEKNRTEQQTGAQESAKANLETEQAKQLGMLGQGKTDADQLVRDMMMGGANGTPKVNPATNQPFTLSEAMASAHSQLKTAELPPDQQSFKNNPDLFAQSKSRIDQMFPNATPEQRAAFYPSQNMTPAQGDKLFDEAQKVAQLGDSEQNRALEHKKQERDDQEKRDSKTVEWTDPKTGQLTYGTQTEAEKAKANWKPSKKGVDDIRHDTVLLNDMQAKLNDVVRNRTALDQGGAQTAIIAKALETASGGSINIGGHEVPITPDPNGAIGQMITAGVLANATPLTREYVQSVLSFNESALALPKMITNSGRQSEIASRALWKTTPGLAPSGEWALGQAKKFQGNLDRLRRGTAEITGEGGNRDYPVPELQSGKAPDGYQIQLNNGHTATVKGGKWIDDTTGQEVH